MAKRTRKVKPEDALRIAQTRRRHLLVLASVVFATFLSALPGDFIWTDHQDLLDGGQRIVQWRDLLSIWTLTEPQYQSRLDGPMTLPSSGSWQPLTTINYSLGWGLWNRCPACFRFENLLWHMAVVIGLYALGRELLAQRRLGKSIAFWAALLFAVHPTTVMSVAWIGGRAILLSSACAIWALVLLTRLPATSKSRRDGTKRWLIGLTGLSALAFGALEIALALPLLALIVAWYESAERGRAHLFGISRSRRFGLIAIFATAGVYLLYRGTVIGYEFPGSYPTASVFGNLGTALRLFWHYVDRVLLPGEPIASDAFAITNGWGAAESAALLGLLLWLIATGVGVVLRLPVAIGSLWFLIWCLPLAGWLPTERYYTEQTLYPAAWGLCLGVTYLLAQLWRPIGRQLMRGSEAVVFAPIVLVLAFITSLSNVRFWSDKRLFEAEIAADPRYVEGRAWLARIALAEDRPADAMNQALNAVDAARDKAFTGYYPRYDIYNLLGEAQLRMALAYEAQGSFATALEIRPSSAMVHHGLGKAFNDQQEYALAEQHLRRALTLRQGFASAQADLGVALIGQGKHAQGLALLEPNLTQGLGSYARLIAAADAYMEMTRWENAESALEAALATSETAEGRAKLAFTLWQLGKRALARENINIALQLEGQSSDYVLWVNEQLAEPYQ
jgi:tetratricopeptide (TPR) repeat protein